MDYWSSFKSGWWNVSPALMSQNKISFKSKDFKDWDRRFRANFFNSIGGFKSINLLATQSEEGLFNVAPFFSVQHVGANPPLMSLIFRPHSVERHSLENLRAQGFATVNAVHKDIVDAAHQAAASYPREISEFEATNLEAEDLGFAVPYVKQARLKFGIKYEEEHTISLNDTILLIASIHEVYLEESCMLEDGLIDHSLIDTLSVNGLDSYYLPQAFKRFEYAQPDKPLAEKEWLRKK